MNERYIAMTREFYGHWGAGTTIEEAKKNLKKSGGKIKNCRILKFTSKLPFAPANREANENEADSWIGRDGSTNWVRCEREELSV